MLVLSIILIVAGAGSLIFGYTQNNSLERQLETLFSTGNSNPGTTWIIIGAIAAVVGVILLIASMSKKKN